MKKPSRKPSSKLAPNDRRPAIASARPQGATVIVCERSGKWAASLRRLGEGRLDRPREVRSIDECARELTSAPDSMVLLEVDAHTAPRALAMLIDAKTTWPRCQFIVAGDGHNEMLRDFALEAGAVHYVSSTRSCSEVVEIIARHFARLPSPQRTIIQRVWESLPFSH